MFEKIGGPMPATALAFAALPSALAPMRAVAGTAGSAGSDAGPGSAGRDDAAGSGLAGTPGETFRMAAFLSSLADPDAPTGPPPTFERTYMEAAADRRRLAVRTGRDDASPAPALPSNDPTAPRPGPAPAAVPQNAPARPTPEPAVSGAPVQQSLDILR